MVCLPDRLNVMGRELTGRIALVTGASRRAGIDYAIARRILDDGAQVMLHSWTPYDAAQPWGADPAGATATLHAFGGRGPDLDHVELDLADTDAPVRLIERTIARFGALDIGVVAWLASANSQPITGRVINAEAGFRRSS